MRISHLSRESLNDLKNKDINETYDQSTDSLEAIRDALDAGMVILQANTRAQIVFPSEVEIPEAGTTNYQLYLYLFDTQGEMEVPDSTPTITIVDAAGNTEVSETAMTNVDAGRYYFTVAIASTEVHESWIAQIKVVEGGDTRYYGANFDLVHDTVGDHEDTTTDTVHGKLGTDTELGDRSIADILFVDGPAAYPAAARPANDVSLAEAIRWLAEYAGQGLVFTGVVDAAVDSATAIISADLIGFGDHYFNTDYVMVVVLDINDVGDAPEGEARDITAYTSATGAFTVTAFSANVQEGDSVMIIRRELLLVDAVPLKTTPITNSLAYRLAEFLAGGEGDWAGSTALPNNISLFDILSRTGDPAFPAAAKAANDVSLAEVIRYISDEQLGEEFDGSPDLWDVLISGGTFTYPAAAAPANNIGLAQVLRYISDTQIGATYDGTPSLYSSIITGFTDAVTPTAVGALIERLQLLQQTLIGNNTIFESTAATVNTVTCGGLVDRTDLYEGQMLVPIDGYQHGQGRYITEYDGDDVLTVVPDWSTDPDGGGNFKFVIVPSPLKFAYEAGKGMSATYDLVNGIPVMTRIYNDYDIQAEDAEETIFEYDDAVYIWHPEWLEWHLDEMLASDTIRVRAFVKDNDTDNNARCMFDQTYTGVQVVPVQYIQLPPTDLYFKVTVEQIDIDTALIDVLFKLYKKS